MAKKVLNIAEALHLFENLPSDNESNESSHSDTDIAHKCCPYTTKMQTKKMGVLQYSS